MSINISSETSKDIELRKKVIVKRLITDNKNTFLSNTWLESGERIRSDYDALPFFWRSGLRRGLGDSYLPECDLDYQYAYSLQRLLGSKRFKKAFQKLKSSPSKKGLIPLSLKRIFQILWVLAKLLLPPLLKKPKNSIKELKRFLEELVSSGFALRAIDFYEELKNIGEVDFNQLPPPSKVGNISYDYYNNVYFNGSTLKLLYQYDSICRHSKYSFLGSNINILEIGGGYGGLGFQFLSQNPNINYIIIDIPQTLAISAYFLTGNFPKMKWAIHDESKTIDLSCAQLHFIPAYNTSFLKGAKLDLVVNSESFLEMDKLYIDKYFDLIQKKNSTNLFYNFNRKKRQEGGFIHYFNDLPYDNKWEILLDRETLFKSSGKPGLPSYAPLQERLSRRIDKV